MLNTVSNFDILISPPNAQGLYPVRVIDSPAGQNKEPSYQPLSQENISELLIFTRHLAAELGDMHALGGALHQFLFPPEIKALFDESLGILSQDDLLRIRLRWDSLTVMNDLGRLPWEYIYDSQKEEFLALGRNLSLVRYLHDRAPQSLAVPDQLRVLAVTASPKGQVQLDLAAELSLLKRVFSKSGEEGSQPHSIALQTEENITRKRLREAITRFKPHVLHFAGHGRRGEHMGELILCDDEGNPDPLPAHDLRILLKDGPVRLAVLNGCETAAQPEDGSAADAPMQSVAGQLVEAGLPAVIGMQYKLPDSIALAFLSDLYSAIAADIPLDRAMTETRIGLHFDRKDKNFWALPALFLRVSDGRIFSSVSIVTEDEASTEPAEPQAAPPFKGLDAYTIHDAHLFFGRSKLTEDLVERLHQTDILAVVGASGSGKSSVVQAGVAPVFTGAKAINGVPPPLGRWRVEVLTPTAEPLTNLARVLFPAEQEIESRESFAKQLAAEEPQALLKVIRGRLVDPKEKLLLIVDQFEELFTQCKRPDVRRQFIHALLQVVESDHPPLKIILTLRADFYDECIREAELRPILEVNQAIVGAMSRAELRQAIEEPASLGNWQFQEGLVELMLDEVEGQPGALPLLSHALLETWRNRRGRTMTLAGYAEAGGVRGAIATTAEDIYQKLGPPQQRLARRIFQELTELREAGQDTRRRVAESQLPLTVSTDTEFEIVLGILIKARLVATGLLNMDGNQTQENLEDTGRQDAGVLATYQETTYEITHEALIREWPRLREWLQEDRDSLMMLRRIIHDAQEWKDKAEHEDFLYPEARLAPAEEWARKADPPLTNDLARRFLTESRLAIRESIDKERRRAAEAETQALHAQTLALISLSTLLLPTGRNLTDVEVSRSLLMIAQGLKQSQKLARPVSPRLLNDQARKLLAEIRKRPVQQVLKGSQDRIFALAFDPQGRQLAAGGSDFKRDGAVTICLWNLLDPDSDPLVLEGQRGEFFCMAFDPQSHWFASGECDIEKSGGSAIYLWNLANPEAEPLVLESHGHSVSSLAFDPQGRWLASGGGASEGDGDTTIHLWDLANLGAAPLVLEGHRHSVTSMTFNSSSRWLASGGQDGRIYLWALSDPETEPLVLEGNASGVSVSSLAFNPDDSWLAAASFQEVRLWNLADLAVAPDMVGDHSSWVNSIAFSPQGRWLAYGGGDVSVIGGVDTAIRLWDLADQTVGPILLEGHNGVVHCLAFDPHDRLLASGSEDGTIRLWDLSELAPEPDVLADHGSWVNSVAFDPQGRWLASGGGDPTVVDDGDTAIRLWDMADRGIDPLLLEGHERIVWSLAFDPQGRWLATGGDGFEEDGDSAIRLWDLTNLGSEPIRLADHGNGVQSLAFDPHGRWLASGSMDNRIRLWELPNFSSEPIVLADYEEQVWSVAFDSQSRRIAVAVSREIHLWDLADKGAGPLVLAGHTSEVLCVSFDPQERLLASGSEDGTIRLWDLSDRGSAPVVKTGHEGVVYCLAFAPDGRWLASGSQDRTIRLWDLSEPTSEPAVLEGHENSVLSVDFDPLGRWLASGSMDGTIRIWRTMEELTVFACNRAGRNFTWEEWQQFLTGRPYEKTCNRYPVHSSVPIDEWPAEFTN